MAGHSRMQHSQQVWEGGVGDASHRQVSMAERVQTCSTNNASLHGGITEQQDMAQCNVVGQLWEG